MPLAFLAAPLAGVRARTPPAVTRRSPRMAAAGPRPLVPILMGSAADLGHCRKIADALDGYGIESELRIASAHKVPERLLSVIRAYDESDRAVIYVAVAGRSNALSGMLDCATSGLVVSCPPYSDAFGGTDLFSSIRMPSGVGPVLVLDPANAALAVAKSFGVWDEAIRKRVSAVQMGNRDRLIVDDAAVVTQAYMSSIAAVREARACMLGTEVEDVLGAAPTVGDVRRGKVRDQYDFVGDDGEGNGSAKLVALVTTDRQSAFDRVLAAIPFKGAVLNRTAAWWFENTKHIIPNHVVAVPHPNVTVARRCEPFPVEFVVRGYITGSTDTSLWKNYDAGVRTYCGTKFPDGLLKNQKLDFNVLTPTTKEAAGDRPISPEDVVKEGLMTQSDWDACAAASLALFAHGQAVAKENGLILVDTKYEFGRDENGTIRLIDEIHTPDSSRYWLSTSYAARLAAGNEPENIDKEFLRLWFRDNCEPYDKSKDLPEAPADLVDELSRRYIMLFELITGQPFDLDAAAEGSSTVATAMAPFVSGAGVKPAAVSSL